MAQHTRTRPITWARAAIAGTTALTLTACAATDALQDPPLDGVVIDGAFDDWPQQTGMLADDDWLYIRMRTDGNVTLQAGDATHSLMLDADANADTGMTWRSGQTGLGADIEIQFSPVDLRPGRGPRGGVSVFVHNSDGSRERVGHADVGLMFAPTYASDRFEMRLSRHAIEALGFRASEGARVTAGVRVLDPAGAVIGSSPPSSAEAPSISDARPRADVAVPTASDDEIRVMSLNVLFTEPLDTPEPFARMVTAMGPDILLLQEWEKTGAEGITSWLNENVPVQGPSGWNVMTSDGWGVAVASPHPITRLGPKRLPRPTGAAGDDREGDRMVRFAGAVVQTPLGPVAASSIHLKCCGGARSPEDATRLLEARAINEALTDVFLDPDAPAIRVVGGDFNLVGTRPPLDILRADLDVDRSDLVPVDTRVLGDNASYTWWDAESSYTPGRLDWLVVSDASAEIVRGFALDTERLTPERCRQAGLEPADSRATDHMVLIVDLRPLPLEP